MQKFEYKHWELEIFEDLKEKKFINKKVEFDVTFFLGKFRCDTNCVHESTKHMDALP